MRKFLAVVLTVLIVLGALPSGMSLSHAAVTFKDVPKDSWYYEHVQYVANDPRELMVGYAGNFGPLDNLTVEQFIKITAAAAGRGVVVPSDKYWGDVYVPIGLELGFVLPEEFTDYKRAITRAEMARIIIRSLPSITGEKDISYVESDIKTRMIDYDSIPVNLREYVCQAYQLGILVGGADGKFNPNGNLTRASAAAVIHNMLDPSVRTVYTPPEEIWSDEEFEAYTRANAEDYPSIVRFENRKIYWKNAIVTTPTLLPENNNPDINDLIYDCAKTMAYYASKNGNVFSCGYTNFFGGEVYLSYHIVSKAFDPNIDIMFFSNPQMSYIATEHAPGEQKNPSFYVWTIAALYEEQFIDDQGFEYGMDITTINWVQEKYKNVLLQSCMNVFGQTQGKAFCDFLIERLLYVYFTDFEKDDQYIGHLPGANVEVAYYFKVHEAMDKQFWSTKPEVRK